MLSDTHPVPFPPAVADELERLARDYGVSNVRVFGSYARGDATAKSDVDLLVDCGPTLGGFAFVHFCDAVAELLQRPVDVVTERSLPPPMRTRVLTQAVPLREFQEPPR